MIVDLYLVYSFIKRLATPFENWKAFKLGIIDKDGNILKKRKEFTTLEEKNAFGYFDLMVLKLKKIINKVPGGEGARKLASYAAALWLIKEHNMFTDSATPLNESVEPNVEEFLEWCELHKLFNSLSEENTVGTGAVAGLGIGPEGEPGIRRKRILKLMRREDYSLIHKDKEDPLKNHGVRRTIKMPKKPTKPKEPIT